MKKISANGEKNFIVNHEENFIQNNTSINNKNNNIYNDNNKINNIYIKSCRRSLSVMKIIFHKPIQAQNTIPLRYQNGSRGTPTTPKRVIAL